MFGKGIFGTMWRHISSMLPEQKSVRERHYMNHLVTCLVNVTGVNRESVFGRVWRRILSKLLAPLQKSVRGRRFMNRLVTCLVNASGVNGEKCSKETLLGACCDTFCQCSQSRKVFGKGFYESLSDVICHIFGTNRESVRKRLVPAHFAGQCVMCQINMQKECFAGYLQNQKE